MKINLILIIKICTLATLTLSSCIGKNSSTTSDSTTKPPEGFEIGEIKPYIGKNKPERNFISQFNSYGKALLRSDIDNAKIYLYPDAINYFKKIYPNEYSKDDIIKGIFKGAATMLVRLDSIYSVSGVEFSIVVGDIKKQIDLGETKIYIFDVTMQLFREDAKKIKFLHTKATSTDKTLGISLNNGQNWTFLSVNDDTPNILRLKFSEDIINQVMEY